MVSSLCGVGGCLAVCDAWAQKEGNQMHRATTIWRTVVDMCFEVGGVCRESGAKKTSALKVKGESSLDVLGGQKRIECPGFTRGHLDKSIGKDNVIH